MGDIKNKFHIAANYYLARGWNVIPFNFKKAIVIDGKIAKQIEFPVEYRRFHEEKATVQLVDNWWGNHNGIAIVTGRISGITVIDIDTKALPEIKELPKTFRIETQKGYHFYFKYNPELKTSAKKYNANGLDFNIDIRNDGGIVFAPPSGYELPNKEIAEYKIIEDSPLADFPIQWGLTVEKKYDSIFNEKTDWKSKIQKSTARGNRNVTFTSIIGGFLHRFPQDDWNSIAWPLIRSHNAEQSAPLSEKELKTIFDSISQKELQRRVSSGEIKDIISEFSEEEIRITVNLDKSSVKFKAKNIVSNLMEGTVITWIEKENNLTNEIPFYFKLKSDSNKEQWVRILSKAFDKKENKEVYPWMLLINKAAAEIEKAIKEKKQDFDVTEVEPKNVTWMLEPFVQEDQINTFYGLGSSGKTLLSIYFAQQIVKEKNYNTLFIDYENDVNSWASKIYGILKEPLPNNFIYFESEQIPVAEQIDKLKEVIKKRDIKLIIVDSASLASGDSTSDEKAALRLIAALKLLKITIILIAHQRKNDGERTPIGSIQYENQSRNVWNFTSEQDDSEDSILHIACKHTKANNTYLRKNPLGFRIIFKENIEIIKEDAIDNFEEKFNNNTRIIRLLEQTSYLNYKEISEKLGISVKTTSKILSKGKKNQIFDNNAKGQWYLRI